VLRSALFSSLTAFAVLVTSCTHHGSEGASDAPSPSASGSATAKTPAPVATEAAGDDEIKPVYPKDAGPPDPLAQRLCEVLEKEPLDRVASCCATPALAASMSFSGECVRTLTSALHSHAVTVAEADVARCAEAMDRATQGCDWVTPTSTAGSMPLPTECEGVIHGALGAKARCRSSLECADGLRCQGLSAIDVGTCGPPKGAGAACNVANDMLTVYTRQTSVDATHAECAGYCRVRQCRETVAVGHACSTDRECGKGRCDKGVCSTAPVPTVGQPCSTACAEGSRCVNNSCVAAKAQGATCDVDRECRGACVRSDAGSGGTCEMSCPVPFKMPPPLPRVHRPLPPKSK
jgi:hypothetical protein